MHPEAAFRASATNKVPARVYDPIKRGLDVCFALLALVMLSPLLLLVALLVYLDDPSGSPMYCTKRCGRDGKLFTFYKYRSMRVNADAQLSDLLASNEAQAPAFKIKNDPRCTRLGRWIRKYAIDETPQLVNVLLGDMSIVGPRPPLPGEVEQYDAHQRLRLSVRPGLTCLWQIAPDRHGIPFSKWVEMDLDYIKRRGFALDCLIVLKTVFVVLTGQGD
jgi:lipopolysaccharide/colanic/teichoic acid biosynthesis glycosyltransferase